MMERAKKYCLVEQVTAVNAREGLICVAGAAEINSTKSTSRSNETILL